MIYLAISFGSKCRCDCADRNRHLRRACQNRPFEAPRRLMAPPDFILDARQAWRAECAAKRVLQVVAWRVLDERLIGIAGGKQLVRKFLVRRRWIALSFMTSGTEFLTVLDRRSRRSAGASGRSNRVGETAIARLGQRPVDAQNLQQCSDSSHSGACRPCPVDANEIRLPLMSITRGGAGPGRKPTA